ncbi:MAG: alcohol dehydrogenase catalytic domain-containing protein [Acidobacteria bacterium]|nr:alcohol dehydrogenase catalytic domain-containing protein [Acidobacteriota bacterium]
MKCAVFHGPGDLRVEQRPTPQIGRNSDVLLRVEAASLCGTDLHILANPPGHPATPGAILGHEYLGEIVDAGNAVEGLQVGDRVVVDPNITCGRCAYCRRGANNLCLNMTTLGIFLDGGFAEYNVAPVQALYPISKQTPLEQAIFAEPLSCVLNSFGQAGLKMGDNVVILGAGPIGLLFLMLFRSGGAGRLGVAEISANRSRLAAVAGADVVWNPRQGDLAAQVKEWSGLGADIVVDSVGSLFAEALKLVRRGGRVVLFGMNSQAAPAVRQYEITRHEISIVGTYIAGRTFPQTVRTLESGRLPLESIVTHRIGLDGIQGILPALQSGEAVEVIIRPE